MYRIGGQLSEPRLPLLDLQPLWLGSPMLAAAVRGREYELQAVLLLELALVLEVVVLLVEMSLLLEMALMVEMALLLEIVLLVAMSLLEMALLLEIVLLVEMSLLEMALLLEVVVLLVEMSLLLEMALLLEVVVLLVEMSLLEMALLLEVVVLLVEMSLLLEMALVALVLELTLQMPVSPSGYSLHPQDPAVTGLAKQRVARMACSLPLIYQYPRLFMHHGLPASVPERLGLLGAWVEQYNFPSTKEKAVCFCKLASRKSATRTIVEPARHTLLQPS